jgi:hypothetical protein
VARWVLVQALVWAVVIEVALALLEDSAGVSFVVDQHFVGALFADRSDEPFGVAVSPWCLRWGLDHLDALRSSPPVDQPWASRCSDGHRSVPDWAITHPTFIPHLTWRTGPRVGD